MDDEPLAPSGMPDDVSRTDFLLEVGRIGNGVATLGFLRQHKVDLLLLDVQMPGLSVLSYYGSLSSRRR